MLHIFLGYEYKFTKSFHLHLTVRGLERIHQHVPQRAKPITVDVLSKISQLSSHFTSFQRSVFACGLLLFFTMARVGSILPSSRHTPKSQFLTQNRLNLTPEGILITLLHTKNIQFGRRRLHIPLVRSNSPLCPVQAYLATQFPRLNPHLVPVFTFEECDSTKWLTKSRFIEGFHALLHWAGVADHHGYTGHSFRRGGASWAFQCGMPGELIQVCGDWASDTYKRYLEFGTKDKMRLAALLVKDLPSTT